MTVKTEPKIPLSAYLTPADRAIAAFGGVRALARAVKRNPSSVQRWTKPKPMGLNGRVPSVLQSEILKLSKERGLGLTAEHLIG